LIDLKKLSVLAITALLVTGISGITAAAGAKPAPSTASLPSTSLTVLVTSLINNVGDDTFSIIDLTTLVTTLTDPLLWPLKVLAALYARRWKIELYLDDIKTTLHMEMLSCLTPAMIHKELEMHLIAYNFIRSIMAEAASVCHAPLDRLSFKGTLDTARQYSHVIAQTPASNRKLRRQLYAAMLAVIAQAQVPERPDRFEPRCQKRRPKAYPFMNRPRWQLKAAGKDRLPSRKNRRP